MLTEELLTYLFDNHPNPLAQPMQGWVTSSRRFTAFVTTFRSKIRKKFRTVHTEETLLDLRLELETAYLLLQERPLSVTYEPLPPRQSRAPDFAVTYTTRLTLMLEVTRLHSEPIPIPDSTPIIPLINERLVDTICDKLRQLLPQKGNVLLIGVEALPLTQRDLSATMVEIQQRVEGNDVTFFQRQRFRDRVDFFRHYQRLSEILVRGLQVPITEPLVVWVNPQAKHALPSKVRTVLYRSQTV